MTDKMIEKENGSSKLFKVIHRTGQLGRLISRVIGLKVRSKFTALIPI